MGRVVGTNRSLACQKQFRPRKSFNVHRRSRLGAKPAGLEENVLVKRLVWGWVRAWLRAGSLLQPSAPGGKAEKGGEGYM